MTDKVWVVGFSRDADDDFGIECVCESKESAELEIKLRGIRSPSYKFYIWGDYNIIRLIPLGD